NRAGLPRGIETPDELRISYVREVVHEHAEAAIRAVAVTSAFFHATRHVHRPVQTRERGLVAILGPLAVGVFLALPLPRHPPVRYESGFRGIRDFDRLDAVSVIAKPR